MMLLRSEILDLGPIWGVYLLSCVKPKKKDYRNFLQSSKGDTPSLFAVSRHLLKLELIS